MCYYYFMETNQNTTAPAAEINLQDFVARKFEWMVTFSETLNLADRTQRTLYKTADRIAQIEDKLVEIAGRYRSLADSIDSALESGMNLGVYSNVSGADSVAILAERRNELYMDLADLLGDAGWTIVR
jgi:hypothetical protein